LLGADFQAGDRLLEILGRSPTQEVPADPVSTVVSGSPRHIPEYTDPLMPEEERALPDNDPLEPQRVIVLHSTRTTCGAGTFSRP
jgi:hypothetical protein